MSGARQGRRRRILQEEVLSASREVPAYSPTDAAFSDGGEGRRYAFDEGSLGEALARRHFPNRLVAPAAMAVASVAAIVGVAALHQYRHSISESLGEPTLQMFDATQRTSLATWLASATVLAVAVLATMVLSVRRRRVDDYRGRHRRWRGAIAVAVLLSIDAVTNLHSVAAHALSTLTGVQLMVGGAEWWVGLGTLLVGWVGLRVLLDVRESKLALTLLLAAGLAGGLAVVVPMAGVGGASAPVVGKLAQLTCYMLLASSLVAYMRFLRADVAGGVATKPQKTPQKVRAAEVKLAQDTVAADRDSESDDSNEGGQARRKAKRAKAAEPADEETSRWTDGSDGYSESYEDDGSQRKLSKSERKRIRQQKAVRRAA